ncbi:MAG: hypothetical protein M1825_001883 [Sarcosagium campestre]|nr:MAG: hypothetical protein M1825_001883 [Sarcosagium campestre]
MHVDAFFEYCLGKPHVYYMQIPPDEGSLAQSDRDGVPPEEDLAIRALRPESRPKRGRRKTEEKDTDSGRATPAKRPHLDTSVATVNPENFNSAHSLFRDSGLPSTARTDDLDGHSQRLDPWTAASNITPRTIGSQLSAQPMTPGTATGGAGGLHFRWRVNAREGSNTPSTPVGYSSATPISALPPDSAVDEPSSAITSSPGSSKNRARRRHGPAVSSAWPSGGNPVTGKLRGRPPSNRSVRDGPFSTFPANPKTREGPVIDLQGTPVSTPITGRDDANDARRRFSFSPQAPSPLHHQGPIKPGALQLQVPHHVGGAVRLATPTVLVNGESDGNPPTTVSSAEPHRESMRQLQHAKLPPRVDELVQHLGSKLMVAAIVNGATGFDFTLGKRLALQVLEDLQAGGQTSRKDNAPPELFAVYFGLLSDLGMPMGVDAVMKDLRVQMASDTEVAARNRTQANGPSSAQSFLLSWTMGLGALSGNMTMLVSLPYEEFNEAPNGSSSGPSDDATSWKERFFELQKRTDERSASTRRKVLEALL